MLVSFTQNFFIHLIAFDSGNHIVIVDRQTNRHTLSKEQTTDFLNTINYLCEAIPDDAVFELASDNLCRFYIMESVKETLPCRLH